MSLGHRVDPASRIRLAPEKQNVSPYKTYDITKDGALSGVLQIHSKAELLYTIHTEGTILSKNKVALHKGDKSGSLLATVKLDKRSELSIKIEHSALSSSDDFALTRAGGAFDEFYKFEAAGQQYAWQKTGQGEVTTVGPEENRCTGLDWKLVHDPTIPLADEKPQEILAVYLHSETWRGPTNEGWIYWTGTPLNESAEVVSLAVVMGAVRQSRKGTRTRTLEDVFGGGAAIGVGGAGP